MPFPSPGDLPDPAVEARSPTMQVDSLPFEPLGKPITCFNSVLTFVNTNVNSLGRTDAEAETPILWPVDAKN